MAKESLGPREMGVLYQLLKYTIAMLSLPILSYFVFKKYVFENMFGIADGTIHSVIFTVVVIHIIIGMYIYAAIKEEREDKAAMKDK